MISLRFLDPGAAFSRKSFCFFVKSSCWFAAASQFWVLETSRPVINTRLIKVKKHNDDRVLVDFEKNHFVKN